MHISISRSLLLGVIISLVPFLSLRAQRATQVVRYSITGVTQGTIDREPGGPGGPRRSRRSTTSGTSTSGFGSVTATNNATTPGTPVTTNGSPNVSQRSAGVASAGLTTTTPVWQASYQISNNEVNKKLAISIDSPMPEGMQLTADIGAPPGARAAGMVNLKTAANDVVTAIGTGKSGVIPMAFSLRAPDGSTEDAGARKITFTFISGS